MLDAGPFETKSLVSLTCFSPVPLVGSNGAAVLKHWMLVVERTGQVLIHNYGELGVEPGGGGPQGRF